MTCPCIIGDDAGNCIDCGKPIPKSEEPESSISMGDVPALVNLASLAHQEYLLRVVMESDPTDPNQPRLRFIGNQLMRVPFSNIWKEVTYTTFNAAKKFGFLGNIRSWQEIVRTSLVDK